MNNVDSRVMFSLLGTARTLEDRIERALALVELSPPKLSVLTQLVEAGTPLTLSDLASRMSCVRSNMTQLMDRLEADGLVQRVDDPSDRRSVRAAVTPLGEQRQATGAREMNRINAEFTKSIPAADLDQLARVLAGMK